MGCVQSTDAPDGKPDTSVTHVEAFTAQDSQHESTSRQPRTETIASTKRSDSPPSVAPVGSPGSPGFSSAGFSREQSLPNPFAQREQEQTFPSEAPVQGYVKQKDKKKRGGFDPDAFRRANGRGGLISEPQADMAFSAQSFNGPQSLNNGPALQQNGGYNRPVGQFSSSQPQFSPGQSDSWNAHSEVRSDAPQIGFNQQSDHGGSQNTQHWDPVLNTQPNYISAPEYSNTPQMLEFNDSGAKQYGALGWEQSANQHDNPTQHGSFIEPPRRNNELNHTDEQELENILQEIGDL